MDAKLNGFTVLRKSHNKGLAIINGFTVAVMQTPDSGTHPRETYGTGFIFGQEVYSIEKYCLW